MLHFALQNAFRSQLHRLSLRLAAGAAVALAALSPLRAEILIGQTTALTGPVATSVAENQAGIALYINHVNATGGVHGEKIRLVTLDDRFDPKQAAANARQLIEKENALALLMSRGTPHTEAILPALAQHRVALVGPATGAMVLHEPAHPYVFNVRSSYQAETEKAIEHLHTLMLNRIAVVHVDDTFGRDCLAGAMKGFKKTGLQPATVIAADRLQPDHAAIIAKIQQSDAQAVLWVGSNAVVSTGIKALRQAGSRIQVVTVSNNASGRFIEQLGKDGHGVIVTQVFPSVRAMGLAINREAAQLAKAAGATLSPQVMEGYASAKVLVEALRRAGPKPTRERIVSTLNAMSHFDLGGLELGYGPNDHTGLSYVDLSIIGSDGQYLR